MTKYSFRNDYSEGAHPLLLEAISKNNIVQELGYAEDSFCTEAIRLMRKKIKNENVDIHFVSGGTQANLIVISSILKPYESIIAAETAHIAVHETGAIEASGHKINTVKTDDGKLNISHIQSVIDLHTDEHMVKPRAVFISNSTEIGSIYSANELKELSDFCKSKQLYLYMDGARLASALTANINDLSLTDIAKYVDVFYIGGTKNGALMGEAIVIVNQELKNNFRFYLKQKGALLAKARIMGVQFAEFFRNDLYFQLAGHANAMAQKLAVAIANINYNFLTPAVTNQIFPIFPNRIIAELSKMYGFYVWQQINEENSAIRLVTSWATNENFVDMFIKDLREI